MSTETAAQIPQPDVDKALPVPPPKLYSPGQMTAAVVLGSFLAAGFLARANLVALGKEKRGNAVFAVGALLTMVLLAIAMAVPKIPSFVFVGAQVGAVLTAAKQEFGEVKARRSHWGVVGYGFLGMLIVCAVVLAAVFVLPEGTFPE